MCLGVRGRQRDSLLGELSEDKPKPLPRQKRLQDDDDVTTPVPASRTSPNVLDHRMPAARRTPTSDQRTTPVDRRNLPADEQFSDRNKIDDDDRGHRYSDSRRSPLDRHDFTDGKSPYSDIFRRSPLDRSEFEEEKESFERYGASRKSPSDKPIPMDRKSPIADRRPSNTSDRKSPYEGDLFASYNRQKSPADDRKSPSLSRDLRKTPVDFQRKKESSPSTQKRGSVVDFLTESTGVKETESSDEEKKYRARHKSGSPQSRGPKSSSPSLKRSGSTEKNPFDEVCKSAGGTSKASKRNRTPDSSDVKPGRHHSQVTF